MEFKVETSANVVKPGGHVARITDVIYGDSQYGKTVKFLFAVADEADEPIISGLCSANKLTPQTKLYRWLSALNGGNGLEKGAVIEPDTFIDTMVEILVTNSKKDDTEYSNVAEIVKLSDTPF